MRVLILGGSGFLGGRLALFLSQMGHKVFIGSRKKTEYLKLPNIETKVIDWSDDNSLDSIFESVDFIIHAAGMNSRQSLHNPKEAEDFKDNGTSKLILAAMRANIHRFIYLSSAHVYASPLTGTISEKKLPQNSHPYAKAHIAAEKSILKHLNGGKIQFFILRLANIFGVPYDKDLDCWTLLVNDLCRQAVEKKELILTGHGNEKRDFLSATQLCEVINKIIESKPVFIKNRIFNIGSGVSFSTFEMAQLIQQRCLYVLGFLPDIKKSLVDQENDKVSLFYKVDKISKLGIEVDYKKNTHEIDDLLRFCNSTYG